MRGSTEEERWRDGKIEGERNGVMQVLRWKGKRLKKGGMEGNKDEIEWRKDGELRWRD